MKKILNTAPPVVMATTRTPLTGLLTISSNGGALTQVYDAIAHIYEPEDRSIFPLKLSPVVSIIDPDTGDNVPLSIMSQVSYLWFVNNSSVPVVSENPSDDYYLETIEGQKTGSLIVRHNVSHDDRQAVPVRCELSFVDSGRLESYHYEAEVLLTSEDKVQDLLDIRLCNPSKVTFNPITSNSSQRTFKAEVYNATERVSAGLFKFFWYVDGELADTKPCYVSGQNTDTLILDAEYADNVLVSVRIAVNSSATEPDHPARADCTLVWDWPRMSVTPYSISGESVKLPSHNMSFCTIVQAYGKDITEAKRNRYCKVKWYTQPTDTETRTDQGYGFEKTISGSTLFKTSGVKVNVGAVLYAVGAKHSPEEEGELTVIASTERPVVVTTIRLPLTGSLFISGDGGSLTQVYDTVNNIYEPEDRRVFPLRLIPVSSITDPDTGQVVPITSFTQVDYKWYVNNTLIVSKVTSDDYYLETDVSGKITGNLVVRHNVGPEDNFAVTVLCEIQCTDNLRMDVYTFDAAVMLTTEEKAQEMLNIQLCNPAKITYNPISENISTKTFKAKVYNGSQPVAPERIKFFWYVDDVLAGNETMLGYVSGQYTDTLTLDAEYLDNVLVTVRIATGTTANAPDYPAKAECTLIWNWPRMQAIPYSMSGQTIRRVTDRKKFGSIIQAYSKDISQEKREAYCRVNYLSQPTSTMEKKDHGWGDGVEIPGSDLMQAGGGNVNIDADLYILGTLKQVVDDETGNIIIDDNGRKIVWRE